MAASPDGPGERFEVDYAVTLRQGQALEAVARDICIEQTVEVPEAAIPASLWDAGIPGRVERVERGDGGAARFTISYPCDLTAYAVPQFLNTLFGNISLQDNIRITDLRVPPALDSTLPGPGFGAQGVRRLLGVWGRPLACTALKPVGLDAAALARVAFDFALGGADLVKDDHGITNQRFAPFADRVPRVQAAIDEANSRTGRRTLYCPMLNDEPEAMGRQTEVCAEAGVRGLLAAPMLIGAGSFAALARSRRFVLMAHPAFAGTFFHHPAHGAAPAALLGTLFRLLGGDVSIFPHFGGRFPFTEQDCRALAEALRRPLGGRPVALPAPAGGMTLARIAEMSACYGSETVFVVGGDLLHGGNRVERTRLFLDAIRAQFTETLSPPG